MINHLKLYIHFVYPTALKLISVFAIKQRKHHRKHYQKITISIFYIFSSKCCVFQVAFPIHSLLSAISPFSYHFYIPDSLMPAVRQIGHTPCSVSDHYHVDLTFDNISKDQGTYGPGYWKCNASILSDPNLIEDINYIYNGDLSKCPIKDGDRWEECKRVFKALNIPAEFLHN